MESQRASEDDIIIFPGQDYDHHAGGPVEDTTSRSREEGSGSGSRTAVIVLSVLGVTLLLCCLVFLLYRSEKKERGPE